MAYEMKPLSCSPSQLKGFSEKLAVSHYENNYGGAVNSARPRYSSARARCASASARFHSQPDRENK